MLPALSVQPGRRQTAGAAGPGPDAPQAPRAQEQQSQPDLQPHPPAISTGSGAAAPAVGAQQSLPCQASRPSLRAMAEMTRAAIGSARVQPRVALRRQTSRTADRYVHRRVCLGSATAPAEQSARAVRRWAADRKGMTARERAAMKMRGRHSPRGRGGGGGAEHVALVTQYGQVSDSVGEHHRQVHHDAAQVVPGPVRPQPVQSGVLGWRLRSMITAVIDTGVGVWTACVRRADGHSMRGTGRGGGGFLWSSSSWRPRPGASRPDRRPMAACPGRRWRRRGLRALHARAGPHGPTPHHGGRPLRPGHHGTGTVLATPTGSASGVRAATPAGTDPPGRSRSRSFTECAPEPVLVDRARGSAAVFRPPSTATRGPAHHLYEPEPE